MEATQVIFILGIVLVVAAIFASAAASGGNQQRIRQHLVEQGATDIFISKAWAPGDQATNTYDVAFTDSQGKQRRTRCQVRRVSWFGNPEIDWEESI